MADMTLPDYDVLFSSGGAGQPNLHPPKYQPPDDIMLTEQILQMMSSG